MKFLTFITLFAVATVSTHGFANPLTLDDKLKSCMATIYSSQVSYHQKNKSYTDKINDLSINQDVDCKGTKISFKEANKSAFRAEVSENTSLWVIDSSKTMTKLK